MDALKSAGRAMIRKPSAAKQSWTAGRHRKLPENWTDTRETILAGMTFHVRHLGTTLVDRPKGEDLAAAAVKRIVATAKASGKKAQKVGLKVSTQGIAVLDRSTDSFMENISIYRISYCTVDKVHDRLFAFIAQNTVNGTLECHAYLCSTKKVARAVALTVAQAFRVAFELWQVTLEEKGRRGQSGSGEGVGGSSGSERSSSPKDVASVDLLDFEDNFGAETNDNVDQLDNHRTRESHNNPSWKLHNDLDEAFSRLALSRTNSQILDPGLMPQDWLSEPDWNGTNGNAPGLIF
ncbi:low density lipoprotein receptor adapter protein 1a [Syngnathoides biaculeatus]|uniref:low density lipoprotein receptor adapter protein 1a n=1 Tax=Syngnathoides biaculeatus TaxID=300417 RepID=UPI002ADD490D|nr:low density lipoprotein receptor adapter protein 1a [Syngnathoides biaculeatus]